MRIFPFLAASFLIIVLIFSSSSCIGFGIYFKKRQGEEVIQKIEEFKIKNHRLPISLSEIGIRETEEGPIYYNKISETKYKVWFGAELGESVSYDSETKQWDR